MAEVHIDGSVLVAAVEQANNVVTILHSAIPYHIIQTQLVVERLAYKAIGTQCKQFAIGIERHVGADRGRLVGHCNRTTSHELQRDGSLALGIGVILVQAQEVTVENDLVAAGDVCPVTESVKLVHAVGPIGIGLALVMR